VDKYADSPEGPVVSTLLRGVSEGMGPDFYKPSPYEEATWDSRASAVLVDREVADEIDRRFTA
jgi:hypothetical protein